MSSIERALVPVRLIGVVMLFVAELLSGTAVGQPAEIDPQARELLEAATNYLAGQKRFSVETRSTIEAVMTSGQKILFDHAEKLSVFQGNNLV